MRDSTPSTLPSSASNPAQIRSIGIGTPLSWLARGWRDAWHIGFLSFAHGVVIALFGGLLMALLGQRFWILAGSLSGFLVIAPVLATSFYAMSRARQHHRPVNWALIKHTWSNWQHSRHQAPSDYWALVQFGLLLGLAATGWVICSAALITLLSPQPIHTPMDFVRHVVLAPTGWLFELWLLMGGVLAAPVFASSAIAMPLLLDRKVSVLQAVLTSWDAVLTNPVPMALWAFCIMGLVAMGFLTGFVGLIVVLPVLGHASWYAYQDLIEANPWPVREVLDATNAPTSA